MEGGRSMAQESDKGKNKFKVKEQGQPYEIGEPDTIINPFIEERYEIIEGVRYELQPAPVVDHQRLLAELYFRVRQTCHPNGEVLFAPLDVYLDEDNQFQPDLVFILHSNAAIITEKRVEGAPDLVAEILSPSTSANDKIRKKRQYARHGVKEYWIVDPVHRIVDQFVLEGGTFALHETYGTHGRIRSPLFACIDIDTEQLFGRLK
jgi:Uma2 family endonuclease